MLADNCFLSFFDELAFNILFRFPVIVEEI